MQADQNERVTSHRVNEPKLLDHQYMDQKTKVKESDEKVVRESTKKPT